MIFSADCTHVVLIVYRQEINMTKNKKQQPTVTGAKKTSNNMLH